MQIPLEVSFEGTDPSAPVRVAIEREVERLEKHNRHIIGCRVAVIAPSHKHRHGSGFQVYISLTVPPHENVIVNHAASDDNRYEHIEVAVKDTFASARPPSTILRSEVRLHRDLCTRALCDCFSHTGTRFARNQENSTVNRVPWFLSSRPIRNSPRIRPTRDRIILIPSPLLAAGSKPSGKPGPSSETNNA